MWISNCVQCIKQILSLTLCEDCRWLLQLRGDYLIHPSMWGSSYLSDHASKHETTAVVPTKKLKLTSFIICKLFGILILGPPHDHTVFVGNISNLSISCSIVTIESERKILMKLVKINCRNYLLPKSLQGISKYATVAFYFKWQLNGSSKYYDCDLIFTKSKCP